MHQEYVTSFFGTASKRVNPAIPSVIDLSDYRFSILEIFLFLHVEDNGILVEYAVVESSRAT